MLSKSFTVYAYGHSNVTSLHRSTWQLTKDLEISDQATCIIGINSSSACEDLPEWLKDGLRNGKKVKIELEVEELTHSGYFYGSKSLKLTNAIDMVFRKSEFVSDRTVGHRCSFSAFEIPDNIKAKLQNPETRISVKLSLN